MKNIVYSYTNDYLIRPTEFMNETFSKMYSKGLEAVKLKRPTKDGRIYKKLSKNILDGRVRLRDRMDFYKDRILSKIDYIVRYDDSDLHTSITAPRRNISFEQIVNTSNLLFNVIANKGSKEVAKILQYGTTGVMNLSRAILDALYKEYEIEEGEVNDDAILDYIKYLFKINAMEGGKGVGKGELMWTILANGVEKDSVGDLKVSNNGKTTEVEIKARDARTSAKGALSQDGVILTAKKEWITKSEWDKLYVILTHRALLKDESMVGISNDKVRKDFFNSDGNLLIPKSKEQFSSIFVIIPLLAYCISEKFDTLQYMVDVDNEIYMMQIDRKDFNYDFISTLHKNGMFDVKPAEGGERGKCPQHTLKVSNL